MPPTTVRAARSLIIVGMLAVGLSACGDDAEQTAQKQVCSARAGITKSIDALKNLNASTVTADAVQGQLKSIRDDLKTIRDAQGDLADDRRSEIKDANAAFTAEIRDVGSTLLRSTSVDQAKTQVKSAIDQLGSTYRKTLATVDCS
jgi:hypothetical protein